MLENRTAEEPDRPSRLGAALVILTLLALAAPIASHVRTASNPAWISDDVRIWVAALAVPIRDGSPADLPTDYLRSISPYGWRLLFEMSGALVDPERLCRILPYPLLGLTLIGLFLAARESGGFWAGCGALAYALSTPLLLERVTGGLARSFAFPCLALGLVALARDRPRALAIAAVVAAWFYPAAGGLLFLSLLLLLTWPGGRLSQAVARRSRRSRAAILVATLALILAPHLPVLLDDRWGRALGTDSWAEFPEAGPGGRYLRSDLATFAAAPREAVGALASTADGARPGLLELVGASERSRTAAAGAVLLAFAVAGLRHAARSPPARRVLLLLPASLAGYFLAAVAYPSLSPPQRYFGYSFPLLLIIVGAAAPAFAGRRKPRTAIACLLVPLGFLALFGWGFEGNEGFTVRIQDRSFFRFLDSTDPRTVIAGFPLGQIENVPLRCRRRALVTREIHQVFHERYTLEMRARAEATFEALFGDERSALDRLRDRYGVDLLLIDTWHFDKAPEYFAPFDRSIERIWRRGHENGFAARAALVHGTAWVDGRFAVLDLARIRSGGAPR